MIINNPDQLKIWLTKILQPLCDADPSALARYVLALLKKDKSMDELLQCMKEQLDVFLADETAPFLSRLFTVIKSEEYITTNTDVKESQDLDDLSDSVLQIDRECTPPIFDAKPQKDNVGETLIANASPIVSPVVSPMSKSQQSSPSKALSAESTIRDNRRRASLRSRSRSRSRSFEKPVRSRSRDRRNAEREKANRQYRNKSPPQQQQQQQNERKRYNDRRGPASALEHRASPKPFSRPIVNSKSRSRSPRKMTRSISPDDNSMPKAKQQRQRCRDFDEKGYCMRGETCPWDHGADPVVLEDINNPSLISIQTAPHLRGAEYNPDAPELWNRGGGGVAGNNQNFGPRVAQQSHNNNRVGGTYPRIPPGGGPANGAGFRSGPFPFPINASATTPLQRELISVPVVDASSGGDVSASQLKRRYEPEDTVAIAEGPTKRKLPINSRLGPRVGIQQNCSLELRKVPRGLNSIAHLNNHFSKFGKIVNIQISYDGDPEAAIVTFSTHAEANVAYRSTEAVLNNRFIKVFWHTPGAATSGGSSNNNDVHAEENLPHIRKANQYSLNNTTNNNHTSNVPAVPISAAATDIAKSTVSQAGVTTTTTTTPSAAATAASTAASTAALTALSTAAATRARNNRVNRAATEIIRKKQEDQVKAAVQLQHGLHKRKHDLLQEYIKQMRSIVDKYERMDNADPQKTKLIVTMKELQATIDKQNKEIAADQALMTAQMQPQTVARKSKEQQKKELLDIELELIAQQQEGNDTTAIQKRIEELQKSLGGTLPPKTHFSTRNARVRPAPPGSTSVDRRPTSLKICGFSAEDSDALLGHFKHFGEITKNQIDKSLPQLIISYATRLNAEQAILHGRGFKGKQLQISWAVPPPTINNTIPPKKTTTTDNSSELNNDNLENILPDSHVNEEIRLDEEEEEEDAESEDRSWRR